MSRYVVFRELASGGMASVFYARLVGPSGFRRTVAVKRPHPQIANDVDFARMFIDEARVASRIHHPNVVATLDAIEEPDELGLVMEYVHGESLSRLWISARERNEPIPVSIAAAIVLDILNGLEAAHEASDQDGQPLGIVHRDISPQNVLVGADGITRIVDFGIAKARGRLHTTRDGAVKGKYAYMAPEQFRGEAVDRRADIYAAAIVFWELLVGDNLFGGTTAGEEVYKAMEAIVSAPSALDEAIPAELDAIVLRGLDRDPEKRFPTARAMAIEIERIAPAVRPSEIAAWVRHLAAEALDARAAVVAEMEGSGGRIEEIEREASSRHSLHHVDVESQRSSSGVVADHAAPSLPRARMSRLASGLALFVVLALLVAGTYGATSLVRAPAVTSSAPEAADGVPSASEIVRPVTLSAAVLDPSANLAAVAVGPDMPAGALDASARQEAPPAAASAKPSGRARGAADRGSCDPPFTVDSAGRHIFLLRCL